MGFVQKKQNEKNLFVNLGQGREGTGREGMGRDGKGIKLSTQSST